MGLTNSKAAPLECPAVRITPEYGYVLMVLALSWVLNMYLTFLVVQARRKYNVKYPTLYAPDSHPSADAFNSVQRAHQNTLETWAPVMLLMLGVGVPAPREAASCGLLWVLGRFAYGAGYAAKGPEGRLLGFMAATFGGQFPLIGLAAYHGAKMAAVLRAA